MDKIMILVFFILNDCKNLAYSPVNTAAIAGKPLVMMCGMHPNKSMYRSPVEWKFQSFGNAQTELLFNGYKIQKNESDLFIINDTERKFNLAKNRSQLRDAGAYHCIKRIQEQQSLRTKTNIAQLTILESDPVCGSNASNGSVVEGDHLRIWCSVNYSGNLDPVMEWSRNDGSIVASTVSYSNDTFLRTVTSTSHQTTNESEHSVVYFCKTYFKKPIVDSQKEGSSSATNAPDYNDDCNLTINALFGPRNLSITPMKSNYYKGDVLICSASGNPTPTYEWIDVHTGYVVSGPILIIKERMGQGKTNMYQCTAENVVDGKNKAASEKIIINIAAKVDSIEMLNIGLGVIAAILLVTLLGVCSKKLKETFAGQAKEENEISKFGIPIYAEVNKNVAEIVPRESSGREARILEDIEIRTNSDDTLQRNEMQLHPSVSNAECLANQAYDFVQQQMPIYAQVKKHGKDNGTFTIVDYSSS